MTTAYFLVLLGVMSRLLPHSPNAVALGATALYAGARLPRRWAIAVPLAALALSDFVIDLGHGYAFYPFTRATTYAIFAGIALLGTYVPRRSGWLAGAATRLGMSVVGSTLFFLLSNFAVWAEGSGLGYPLTFAGLLSCYQAGLPFFSRMLGEYPIGTLEADLIGTTLLFGVDALATHFGLLPAAKPEAPAAVADTAAG